MTAFNRSAIEMLYQNSIENLFLAATAEGYGCNLRIPLGNEGVQI